MIRFKCFTVASFILCAIFCSVFCSLLFFSCSRTLGYSVLLWDFPEDNLRDGEIVRVFIRSNISRVYVIEVPGSRERREIPLWQLTNPVSRSKAKKTAERYAAYLHKYAYSKIDGLPIHTDSSNTSKNAYRLRKNEVIKILYDGKGQPVMAGAGVELPGKWLYVLTTDGTEGWCYSYSLEIFESDGSGAYEMVAATDDNSAELGADAGTDAADDIFVALTEKIWYPDEFRTLINNGTVDLSVINDSNYFKIDMEQKNVAISLPDAQGVWSYNGVEKSGNVYRLKDVPITVTVRNENYIVVRYTKDIMQDFDFVSLDMPLDEIIEQEIERRRHLLEDIFYAPIIYTSSNYGTLEFTGIDTFSWRNYSLLVPSLIPNRAGNVGYVSMNYILSKQLSTQYDGVLSFKFENATREVNFLYKLEANGLRLEDASGVLTKGQIVTRRGLSPLVLFFEK